MEVGVQFTAPAILLPREETPLQVATRFETVWAPVMAWIF